MVSDEIFPRPGEQVLVPWGLDEILGEVVEVYSSGLGDRAVIRLTGGADPDSTVTVPADSLIPASGVSRGISPRIDELTFDQNVMAALRNACLELGLEFNDTGPDDRGIDALIVGKRRAAAVQIKFYSSDRIPSDAISVLVAYASSKRPVIVVANAGLTIAAADRLRTLNRRAQIVWYLRWTGQADYGRLKDTIRDALAPPETRMSTHR